MRVTNYLDLIVIYITIGCDISELMRGESLSVIEDVDSEKRTSEMDLDW